MAIEVVPAVTSCNAMQKPLTDVPQWNNDVFSMKRDEFCSTSASKNGRPSEKNWSETERHPSCNRALLESRRRPIPTNDSEVVTSMTPQMTTIIARTDSMNPPIPVEPGRCPVLVLTTC
jgi:hypothetical protein